MTYYTGTADSLLGNPTKANNVELDLLSILQAKLAAQGLKYQAFTQTLGDFETPGWINGQLPEREPAVSGRGRSEIPHSLLGPYRINLVLYPDAFQGILNRRSFDRALSESKRCAPAVTDWFQLHLREGPDR